MGVIDVTMMGSPLPNMVLSMGSGLDVMLPLLVLLAVALFGIWTQARRPHAGDLPLPQVQPARAGRAAAFTRRHRTDRRERDRPSAPRAFDR